jgi:tryptophan synthase alpha chain
MNRIEEVLNAKKQENKKSFIGYLTAGDPSIEHLPSLVKALEKGGCDVIEIGVPFSDPLADGPVIQAAGQRAIEGGTSIYKIFDSLSTFRQTIHVPIAFLVYYNTLTIYGIEAFVKKCLEVGIDGLIIPDLPFEEQKELADFLVGSSIALIPFATPTSKERMSFTLKNGSGFVYTVSSMGVTGRLSEFHADLENYINEVKSYTSLPVAIGFGISTTDDVKRMSRLADAVIVGTEIVQKIHNTQGNVDEIETFVQELVEGLE